MSGEGGSAARIEASGTDAPVSEEGETCGKRNQISF